MSTPAADDTLRAAGLLTLGDKPGTEAVENALRSLGRLADGADDLTREALRAGAVAAVKPHGWRAGAVDAALRGNEPEGAPKGAGSRISLDDPEEWPAPVDGDALVGELVATFLRYLGLPEWAPIVLALWVLHAHAHDAADVSPLLALTSPEKRCGKTTTLHVLGALVPRPLPASNVTAAALFRAVEKFRPTLLVDEADTFLRDREELRGVLNSGHARASAVVVRTVGDDHEARAFSTWSPKAIAMIGDLPDTLADRSLMVPMRRRGPDEHVERLRLDRLSDLEPLRRRAWRWACDHLDHLRAADPDVPGELHDRMADNWRPLLAIADAVGGEWPDKARKAARTMAGADDGDDGSVRTLLLRDIRTVFTDKGADRVPSSALTDALAEMEHRPWPEWGRSNKPMTPTALARMLRPFGVRPGQLWIDDHKVRGYELDDLREVFRRYLPPEDGGSAPVGPVEPRNDGTKRQFGNRYEGDGLPGSESAGNPHNDAILPGLPVREGGPGDVDTDDAQYELVEREAIQAESYMDPGDGS